MSSSFAISSGSFAPSSSGSFSSGSPNASSFSFNGSAGASGSFSASFGGSVPSRSIRSVRSVRGGSSRSRSSSAAPAGANVTSQIEQAIRQASKPIEVSETETVSANGVTGIWLNKQETAGLDLAKYQLFNDPNPEIIKKQLDKIKHKQEISIKYLRPPPIKAGNIIIKQEPDSQEPGAPPLVIRVEGKKDACSGGSGSGSGRCGAGSGSGSGSGSSAGGACGPIIIREAPPKTPAPQPEKVITIPGKKLPPPPRKVVIEKLPDAAAKPRSIILEKWLPYEEPTRKVIFEGAPAAGPAGNPRNVIIEWQAGEVEVEKEFKNLGVVDANPKEYRQKYQFNKSLRDLPPVAAEANSQPSGVAAKSSGGAAKLEGDLHALALVDLDKEGLSQYRHLVQGGASAASAGASGSFSSSASSSASASQGNCGC